MIFADDGAVVHLGNITQQRMRSGARCHRNVFNILDGGDFRLRDLHLQLVGYARFRVGPVIRRDEPA